LNVIYHTMLRRLKVGDDEDPEAAVKAFDGELAVARWRMPGTPEPEPKADVDPGAPWWWSGDEDASQDFLQQMGVNL
jgi:hypothetical protein